MKVNTCRSVAGLIAAGLVLTLPVPAAVAAEEESVSRWEQLKSLYNEKIGASDEADADDAELSGKIEAIKAYYRDSKESTTEMSREAYEWLQDDIAKIGAWEYHVFSVDDIDDEEIGATLAEMGAARWELVSAVAGDDRIVFVLKRQMKSFVKVLPAQDVLKLMGEMSPQLED